MWICGLRLKQEVIISLEVYGSMLTVGVRVFEWERKKTKKLLSKITQASTSLNPITPTYYSSSPSEKPIPFFFVSFFSEC